MLFSIYIILTILSWGLGQVLIKKGLSYLSPWQSYALDTITALVIFIPYSLFSGIQFSAVTASALLIVFFIGINVGLYYFVMEKGPISIIGPVVGAYPTVTIILSFFFLHESLTFFNLAGIIMTIIGVIILSIPEKTSVNQKADKKFWLLLSLIVAFGWGLEGILVKYLVDISGNSTFMILLALGQSLAVFSWYLLRKPEIIIPRIPNKYLLPTLMGVTFWNMGTISYAKAMEIGLTSLVTPLTNLYIVVIVIFSIILLKEKIRLIQLLGLTVITIGIIVLQIPSKAIPKYHPLPPDRWNSFTPVDNSVEPLNREKAKVEYAYDGDTIKLTDGRKVRYIGVNTPEIGGKYTNGECFGAEAMNVNKQLVSGQEVEMEKDISELDKYGRHLRYIWVDNVFINEFLVLQGYARVETIPPDVKYTRIFKEAESEARKNHRGLWGKCK